ncbi:MAG: YidC/Oxa1 family insertase periplasmic-domain containing protein [Planctomycetaceae bacterium]|jgi:YidC/Oxa1 family membrane protein insertase|nr:YidC/Oxa1 family insertase periplasmic-domain containing protein [Planctomycetaceae bacterium]
MQYQLPNKQKSSGDWFTFLLIFALCMMAFNLLMPKPQNPPQVDLNDPIVKNNPQENNPLPKEPIIAPPNPDEEINNPQETPEIVETHVEPEWITLGSMNPKSNYNMLVTLTNQGAAVVRAELNTDRYKGIQELSGYLGQIVVDQNASDLAAVKLGGGVMVQVVGEGTPAQKFALQVGDRVIQFRNNSNNQNKIEDIRIFEDLHEALLQSKPKDEITLSIVRGKNTIELKIFLDAPPMDVIRPETAPRGYEGYSKLGGLRGVVFEGNSESVSDQLSFLTTLLQLDDNKLDLPKSLNSNNSSNTGIYKRDETLDKEILDLKLRRKAWRVVKKTENEAVFAITVPKYNIELVKTYYLAKNDEKTSLADVAGAGYHLKLKIEIKNHDNKEHKIAYQLDGPSGLPLEGGWYAQKTGPTWSRFGIRDIVVKFQGNKGQVVPNTSVALDKITEAWSNLPIEYVGVDSIYFQCTVKPNKSAGEESWHEYSMPIRVGERIYNWQTLTDVSFRLWGRERSLAAGERFDHEYFIFLGPKNTNLLADYGLSQTVSYGWFWFVAKPLLWVLQTFNWLGASYAVAIILLTICVRLAIFPMSRKMITGAMKMAELQPQIQALNEKYKEDVQARSKALNALFKEHNYSPMSGCLPLLIQFPIFIGLYKALSIDPGLYGTPLIPGVSWCVDLSAPDKLFDWSNFWVWVGYSGFNEGQGFLTLGPFFNILPLLTIVLFLVQQEITMPPPAPNDEQAKMQRRMMKFMMIFMGLLFFKVPSGLCFYFIVSTAFALVERKFIPKPVPKTNSGKIESVVQSSSAIDDAETKLRKAKNKRRNNSDDEPPKTENIIAKWIKGVIQKANEERRFEEGRKKKDKKRK